MQLPELPKEAQNRIEIGRRVLIKDLEHAQIYLDRAAKIKHRLEALAATVRTSKERLKLQEELARYQTNAQDSARLTIGALFDVYAEQYWQKVCPDAKKFSDLLPALQEEVEAGVVIPPELGAAVRQMIVEKSREWTEHTTQKAEAVKVGFRLSGEVDEIVATFQRQYARDPARRTELLDKLAVDLVAAHAGKLPALVSSSSEYQQLVSTLGLARTFISDRIKFLAAEDYVKALEFVDAECHRLRADAAKRVCSGEQAVSVKEGEDPVASERAELLRAYKDECLSRNIRVTDKMIAEAACPTWHDRTPVQRWKKHSPRSTPGDDVRIRAVLRNKPHLR